MLTVGEDVAEVERRLVARELTCPGCAGALAGWGHARRRGGRGEAGGVRLRPRRGRCCGCRATHVLLPVGVLLRRADAVAVIGAAITAKATGLGARPIAATLDRPLGTVRGWLRRFGGRAETVRAWFTRLLCVVAADPVPPGPAGSVWADAVAAIGVAAQAVAARVAVARVAVWPVGGGGSAALSPAPGWPPGSINTAPPWAVPA